MDEQLLDLSPEQQAAIVRVTVRTAKKHTHRDIEHLPDDVYVIDARELENLQTLGFAYRMPAPGQLPHPAPGAKK